MHISACACVHTSAYECMYESLYACIYARTHVCRPLRKHVVYVCQYLAIRKGLLFRMLSYYRGMWVGHICYPTSTRTRT